MAEITRFPRYSQGENQITNYTLLVFRYLYQESPAKLAKLLSKLVGDDISIGVDFRQQESLGGEGIPDGRIDQKPVNVILETKKGVAGNAKQLKGYVSDIVKNGKTDENYLIAIGSKKNLSLVENIKAHIKTEGAEGKVRFVCCTFRELCDEMVDKEVCGEYEIALKEVLDDYKIYLFDKGLLPEPKPAVFFSVSWTRCWNEKYKGYFHPHRRLPPHNFKFMGLRQYKNIDSVGKLVYQVYVENQERSIYRVFLCEVGEWVEYDKKNNKWHAPDGEDNFDEPITENLATHLPSQERMDEIIEGINENIKKSGEGLRYFFTDRFYKVGGKGFAIPSIRISIWHGDFDGIEAVKNCSDAKALAELLEKTKNLDGLKSYKPQKQAQT